MQRVRVRPVKVGGNEDLVGHQPGSNHSAQIEQTTPEYGICEEFLTIALLTAVTASMVTARAGGRRLRLLGPTTAYMPSHAIVFAALQGYDGNALLNRGLAEGLTALYAELNGRRGFAPRPVLLGRSRGGLWVTSWAAENPEKVAGIAGIYPVFDLRTYPGLEKAAPAYGLSEAGLREKLDALNPVDRVAVLARNRVPVFLIHGDEDKVVPLKENSATLVERYREAGQGDAVTLMVAKGQGRNFWEGFFHCQPLVDFVIARAKPAK